MSERVQGMNERVQPVAYDRSQLAVGIVHIGPGVFHRAHQAWFTDVALAQPGVAPEWGLCEVALQRPDVPDALNARQGLYTLAVLAEGTPLQTIGAVREALFAPRELQTVVDRLAAPATRVVTLTITEKGYCTTREGELNLAHEDVQHDLREPMRPRSAVGLLALGLRARHAAERAPWLAISCDNLPDNSARLRRALLQFLGETAPEVGRWLAGEGRFANTLVDSIAPAVTPALLERVQAALGTRDAAAVHREPYTQWVLEDPGAIPRPAWEAAGALWVQDVKPWELAKLRVLNGGHSMLAYAGLLLGIGTMADAMATPLLAGFAERMLRAEVLPTLPRVVGLDHDAYLRSVLGRIGNPRLGHRLAQIGMDGSQKIPLRLLPCIRENLAAGRSIARLSMAVCLWLCFVRAQARQGIALSDPADTALRAAGRACSGVPEHDIATFLAVREAFDADIAAMPAVRAALVAAYAALGDAAPAQLAGALTDDTGEAR